MIYYYLLLRAKVNLMKKILVNIIYIIEAILLSLWIIICRLIGIDMASKLGSIILQCLDPNPINRITYSNLIIEYRQLSLVLESLHQEDEISWISILDRQSKRLSPKRKCTNLFDN